MNLNDNIEFFFKNNLLQEQVRASGWKGVEALKTKSPKIKGSRLDGINIYLISLVN